jgi:hypothetical protein
MKRRGSFLTKRQVWDQQRATMDTVRSSFVPSWRDLADNILPMRPRFMVTDTSRGQRRNQKIIDSTATFAIGTLSAGMMSGMTSPAKPWFRLTTPDPELNELASVKAWLQIVVQRMNTVFTKSNLYDILPELYTDTGVFGTGCFGVFEDDEDVIHCESYPVGSYWIATDAKGRVRTWMREFSMTVSQLVDRFGGDGSEPDWTRFTLGVKRDWEAKDFGQSYVVRHIITTNEEYDEGKLHAKYKQFASCYYQVDADMGRSGEEQFLEEKGFDEFPILAGRWSVSGNDVYATSCPGMIALGDIKQLQQQEKRGAQALDKMVNPPLVGPEPRCRQAVNILPGGITYNDERDGVKGLRALHEVNFHLADLEAKNDQKRAMINRAFYADLFLMLDSMEQSRTGSQPVTAEEIKAREREKLLVLGPVLERFNKDVLSPLIDRVFAIMARRGLIPDAPPELENVELRVEYISIMAQAQKIQSLATLERFSSYVSNLALNTQRPDVLDKWDMDQTVDVYADSAGIDPHLVRSDDDVAAMRQARAQAQQQQAAAERMAQMAPAAQQLSQTDTTGKNALTDLLSAAGGGNQQMVA